MSEVVPQIQVTNSAQDPLSRSPRNEDVGVMEGSASIPLPASNDGAARPTSRASKLLPNFTMSQPAASSNKSGGSDLRHNSQTIDPLSHQILKRTNTSGTATAKSRPSLQQEIDSAAAETGASIASNRTSTEPSTVRNDSTNLGSKDRRSRASFFSRFGSKKKDQPNDVAEDVSEVGEGRTEGIDAGIFSQPIGYVPQFPSPPKYIKVRSHGKKEKDFNRVFLAQELRGRTGLEIAQSGGRPPKTSASRPGEVRKDGNAIWAMEFSKDGKHLAAGGKDYVVRVWAVLSTKDERHLNEIEDESATKEGQNIRLKAPVFAPKTVQEYSGHTATVLDLSWSKNNFLLSSSMDKTVRLWHVSREECLCCFKHSDFVTSIQFHPRDDRFFLAGSLDSKLRLWSIPDKSVAYWSSLPEFITAVSFSPDGKTVIAGCFNGLCLFFETEGLKYQTQIHVRSAHGKNAKGSKVTGIQTINHPPDDPNGEVKLLITSNDSRIRIYNLRDKSLELKLKGNDNACSQIRASFSDDYRYIICGSEDCKTYIWPTKQPEAEKDKRPVEVFEAHSVMVTTSIMAPTRTRKLLSASADPVFDLCNPPPVTLVSRTHSEQSSIHPVDESGHRPSMPPTPATSEYAKISKPEESPAYQARCAHPNGNIIITADFEGQIKVFRQDCAYHNRLRNNDSALSKKMLGRTNSVATKHSNRSHRDSIQITNQSSDRILSWRQSINSTTGSLDSLKSPAHQGNGGNLTHKRSISPRKSLGQMSLQSNPVRNNSQTGTTMRTPNANQLHHTELASDSPHPSPPHRSYSGDDVERARSTAADKEHHDRPDGNTLQRPGLPGPEKSSDPLMLHGEQSYMFWNRSIYEAQAAAAHNALDHHHRSGHQHNHHAHFTSGGGPDSTGDNASGTISTAASSNVSLVEGGHAGGRQSLGVPMARQSTNVSRLSSEDGSSDGAGGSSRAPENALKAAAAAAAGVSSGGNGDVNCQKCGGDSFRMRAQSGGKRIVECSNCGFAAA